VTESTPPAPVARCPWCSTELPESDIATCPKCGAHLVGDEASLVPGLTSIDAEAILRARAAAGNRGRSRLLAWLGGDSDEPPPGLETGTSLSPPTLEVRREMLRLELAAAEADLRAEVEALRAESGGDLPVMPEAAATEAGADGGDEATIEADATKPTEPGAAEPDAAEPDGRGG
jgi:hypothetical protein